jgi:hypothetical protein
MKALCTVLFAAMFSAGSAAFGQIYKWVDENGVLTFSDQKPADPSRISNLQEVEGMGRAPLSAIERRTLEILNQEQQRLGPGAHLRDQAVSSESIVIYEGPWYGAQWQGHTENVRDPCLRSSDPRCYELHWKDYDPRLGYAPSVLRGSGEGAAGARAATGYVGGAGVASR